MSCQLPTKLRHITSLFLATFVWTPVCQTSAAKWLPRFIWKGILSTMFSESIVKKFRAVFEKYNIKLSCVMSALARFRHITSLFLATFVWTPVCQTSAAKWLPRLIWKEILSYLCKVNIVKKLRTVFEKYDIGDNLFLYVLGYILYLRLFSFHDICKCLGSCCASFYVAFDKDTFYFVAPKLYVVIWRGRRFWGGHRFLRGPPVAWGATGGLWRIKTSLYIYIYIYIYHMAVTHLTIDHSSISNWFSLWCLELRMSAYYFPLK